MPRRRGSARARIPVDRGRREPRPAPPGAGTPGRGRRTGVAVRVIRRHRRRHHSTGTATRPASSEDTGHVDDRRVLPEAVLGAGFFAFLPAPAPAFSAAFFAARSAAFCLGGEGIGVGGGGLGGGRVGGGGVVVRPRGDGQVGADRGVVDGLRGGGVGRRQQPRHRARGTAGSLGLAQHLRRSSRPGTRGSRWAPCPAPAPAARGSPVRRRPPRPRPASAPAGSASTAGPGAR